MEKILDLPSRFIFSKRNTMQVKARRLVGCVQAQLKRLKRETILTWSWLKCNDLTFCWVKLDKTMKLPKWTLLIFTNSLTPHSVGLSSKKSIASVFFSLLLWFLNPMPRLYGFPLAAPWILFIAGSCFSEKPAPKDRQTNIASLATKHRAAVSG